MFDWRELQRFGISESRLPAGSEIRFRPPDLWDQYYWQAMAALAVVLLQAAMITWLLFERRRRQIAQLRIPAPPPGGHPFEPYRHRRRAFGFGRA